MRGTPGCSRRGWQARAVNSSGRLKTRPTSGKNGPFHGLDGRNLPYWQTPTAVAGYPSAAAPRLGAPKRRDQRVTRRRRRQCCLCKETCMQSSKRLHILALVAVLALVAAACGGG